MTRDRMIDREMRDREGGRDARRTGEVAAGASILLAWWILGRQVEGLFWAGPETSRGGRIAHLLSTAPSADPLDPLKKNWDPLE